jgi:hypothetical protein
VPTLRRWGPDNPPIPTARSHPKKVPAVPIPVDAQHTTIASLREYLRAVTEELGIGLESCTIDHDSPVSAYVALLIILRYLADDTVAPPPHRVARFVVALHADDHTIGQPNAPQPADRQRSRRAHCPPACRHAVRFPRRSAITSPGARWRRKASAADCPSVEPAPAQRSDVVAQAGD